MRELESGCQKWLVVNGVQTCIQVWGGWTQEEFKTDSVIIVVTGNPGITDFYVGFMKELQIKCGDYPVWVIGQAGHVYHPKNPRLHEAPELYDLAGQVKHKKEFIDTHVPQGKSVILVGHSIGAKVAVELMKDNSVAGRVKQVHLMMPCLEHIGESRNGYWFQRVGVRIIPFFVWLAKMLMIVPVTVKLFILKFFATLRFRSTTFDECVLHGVIKLGTPQSIEQAVFLAKDEMVKVMGLDDEVYEAYGPKVFAYYAQKDGWSPLTHYENLRKRHYDVRAVVVHRDIEHAFMAVHAAEMAEELAINIRRLSSAPS